MAGWKLAGCECAAGTGVQCKAFFFFFLGCTVLVPAGRLTTRPVPTKPSLALIIERSKLEVNAAFGSMFYWTNKVHLFTNSGLQHLAFAIINKTYLRQNCQFKANFRVFYALQNNQPCQKIKMDSQFNGRHYNFYYDFTDFKNFIKKKENKSCWSATAPVVPRKLFKFILRTLILLEFVMQILNKLVTRIWNSFLNSIYHIYMQISFYKIIVEFFAQLFNLRTLIGLASD